MPDRCNNHAIQTSNITRKVQLDTVTSAGGKPVGQKATSYDWAYAYGAKQPHAPTHIGNHTYSYDANGNQLGWRDDKNGTRRIILWDEDNRIAEINDNGERSNYTYDDKGQRVIKAGRQGETVYVNQYYVVRNRSIVSKHLFAGSSRLVTRLVMGTAPGNSFQGSGSNPSSGSGNTNPLTRNAVEGRGEGKSQGNAQDKDKSNQGQDKQNNGQGSANSGQGDTHRNDNTQTADHGKGNSNDKSNANANSNNANNAGGNGASEQKGQGSTNLPGNSEKGLENALANGKGNKYGIYKHLAKEGYTVDAHGDIVVDTGDGGGSTGGPVAPPGNGQSDFTYYYHPDHLGSTGYVTDASGRLYEHLEYFPFGETWVQEHSNTLRTPYLFTGKEYDQETGLYYFGARYYDPRTSVWQSADGILNDYLNGKRGMGGIYNSFNLGLYTYSHQNPVKFTDPDGNAPGNENAPVLLLMLFKAGADSYSKGVDERHPKLKEMTPEAKPLVKGVIMLQELKGHNPKIHTAARSVDEEKTKISGGKSSLNNPNSSRHIDLGRGADAADIVDKKYAWGEAPGTAKGAEKYFRDQSESFEQIKAVAGEKGKDFRNGADWKNPHDPAHIENNNRVKQEPPKTSD